MHVTFILLCENFFPECVFVTFIHVLWGPLISIAFVIFHSTKKYYRIFIHCNVDEIWVISRFRLLWIMSWAFFFNFCWSSSCISVGHILNKSIARFYCMQTLNFSIHYQTVFAKLLTNYTAVISVCKLPLFTFTEA